MTARTVDLPAPLGPSRATVSPSADLEGDVDAALGDLGGEGEGHRVPRPRRAKAMTTTATTTSTSESATAASASVSRCR